MKTDEQGAVVLSEKEEVAAAHRDMLVGFGSTVHDAAVEALDDVTKKGRTKKFVDWLSEGTLTVVDGEVTTVEASESDPESEPETSEPDESGESEGDESDDDDDEGESETTESRTPEPANA